ncbi:hypothetical protein EWU23_05695 [Cytophagaceae bacterium 50C-KIRBA]|uniref:Uracil-DNA glycosylase family protein n=1 Tax=Aquirufa beregesia TaxID=2516556 RepID=A0ABX0EX48_9BACT|nr:hypothetical protein [Aquirufa beregesia]NGZ43968.1 hypothetical protein [Aquirufa beregesia]
MEIKVNHQSIEGNWINPNSIKNPQTLVLGSFNPFENHSKLVDYYYGRSSNHFWRTIAISINKNEDYFFQKGSGFQRKKEIMDDRFCCLDVINSITFSATNKQVLDSYLKKEIYFNFKDQKIWAGYTDFQRKDRIHLVREYNQSILEFLKENNSIKRIIHTMGANRVNSKGVKPREKRLNNYGFDDFFNELKSICNKKQITINYESWSPSDYAIKRGSTPKGNLKNWLELNLYLTD